MPQLSYCAEQVRRFDNDRFICSLYAPPDEREALAAVYAFNLEVARIREIAREPLLGHMRLQWWRDAVDRIYSGQPPGHQVAAALAGAVDRFGLGRGYFDRILDARALDLDDAGPPTLDALIEYADNTSATLAELSLEILGETGDAPRRAARDVGIAWALTGILRAVPFHAQARRVYLPSELNRQAGLDVARMFEAGPTDGLARQRLPSPLVEERFQPLRPAGSVGRTVAAPADGVQPDQGSLLTVAADADDTVGKVRWAAGIGRRVKWPAAYPARYAGGRGSRARPMRLPRRSARR